MMANASAVDAAGPFVHSGAASDRNPGGLSSVGRRPPNIELYEVYQPISVDKASMLYPSVTNNPVLTVPANFGGQDGLSNYPIHYKHARYHAGVGQMYDTRDFVNHNLDSRSNDYTPTAVPDPSTISYFQQPRDGMRPANPNGTTNAFNPPYGLPPMQSSEYYFLQQM